MLELFISDWLPMFLFISWKKKFPQKWFQWYCSSCVIIVTVMYSYHYCLRMKVRIMLYHFMVVVIVLGVNQPWFKFLSYCGYKNGTLKKKCNCAFKVVLIFNLSPTGVCSRWSGCILDWRSCEWIFIRCNQTSWFSSSFGFCVVSF